MHALHPPARAQPAAALPSCAPGPQVRPALPCAACALLQRPVGCSRRVGREGRLHCQAGPGEAAPKQQQQQVPSLAAEAAGPSGLPADAPAQDQQQQLERDEVAWSQRTQRFPVPQMPYGAIALLAAGGVAETAYLTWTKLLGAPVACPANGSCGAVLNSDYAMAFGLPLPLFGMAAYGGVAALALRGVWDRRASGAAASSSSSGGGGGAGGPGPGGEDERSSVVLRYALLAGASALATCSCYLMYVLFAKLGGEPCTWCFGSAALSAAILLATVRGFTSRELTDAAGPSFGAVAATFIALTVAWADVEPPAMAQAAEFVLNYELPKVTTLSTRRAVRLAERLRDAGAQMYGAFWCGHCHEQKELFGAAAMDGFPYVECFPNGWRKGEKIADACAAADIQSFPTWRIRGQELLGVQTLEDLERALKSPAPPAASAATARRGA